jgi:hypothetical protein
VFCNPNGIGVSLVNRTTLKARDPEITLKIARPFSVFISLKINYIHDSTDKKFCFHLQDMNRIKINKFEN